VINLIESCFVKKYFLKIWQPTRCKCSGNKHNGRLLEDKKNGSANNSSNKNKGGHINSIINSSSNKNNIKNLSTNKRRKTILHGTLMSMIHGQFSAYHAVHQRIKCPKLFEE